MEILKPIENKTNFEQARSFTKDKSILNGFNKLSEPICNKKNYCKNVLFENTLKADIYLSYPLKTVVHDTIVFNSLYDILKSIKNIYISIYKNPNLYGIWGHSIYDLIIESITIYKGNEQPVISVGIGS